MMIYVHSDRTVTLAINLIEQLIPYNRISAPDNRCSAVP